MSSSSQEPASPTLTQITHSGRLAVKYGSISLVVLMVGRILFNALVAYWVATHPPPPPPPTVGFGRLPAISFPKLDVEKPKSYTLEMASNSFPEFPDRAKIFLMPRSVPNLLADEKVKEIAAGYNYIFEPEVIDSRTYRWSRTQPISTTFKIDVQTLNFSLKSDFLSRPELLINSQLPESFEAVERVKAFLSASSLLPADMATSSGSVVFLKALGGELNYAVSLSDADFLRVNLNRYPIDGIGTVTQSGDVGVVSAILTGAFSGKNSVVQIDSHYHPLNYDQYETYPLRDVRSAWKILQAGEGHIINPGQNEEALIRNVDLAYFEKWDEQDFLQPVYVFRGDTGFVGLVEAIDPRYTY